MVQTRPRLRKPTPVQWGEDLIRTAISEYAARPQWERSKFSTCLTKSDPCPAAQRVRPAHRIDVDAQNSTVSTYAAFTVEEGPTMTTSFLTFGRPAPDATAR